MIDPANLDSAHQPDQQETKPIPVRYWWLKRILTASGVLIVGLLLVRIWWGWEAHRRLEAQIADYVAAGEPIYPEDFDQEPVPDDENAAKMYEAAVASLALTDEQSSFARGIDEFGSAPKGFGELRTTIEANAEALRLARAARDAPGIDWGIKFRSPLLTVVSFRASDPRKLSKVLCLAAVYYHAEGDDNTAIEILRSAFAHNEATRHGALLIDHSVGSAMDGLLLESTELVARELCTESDDTLTNAHRRCATRGQVQDLINDLLDEQDLRTSFARAMLVARMGHLDDLKLVLSARAGLGSFSLIGTMVPPTLRERVFMFPIRPLIELDGLFMLRFCTSFARAAGEPTQMLAESICMARPPFRVRRGDITHLLSRLTLPTYDHFLERHFRSRAFHRIMAVALALRLYEVDNGHRAAHLGVLVPEYLEHIPIDPFGDGTRTLSYKPDAVPAVLYSVGANWTDEAGMPSRIWNEGDITFFLNGARPDPLLDMTHLLQAPDNSGDTEDEKGDDNENQTHQDHP